MDLKHKNNSEASLPQFLHARLVQQKQAHRITLKQGSSMIRISPRQVVRSIKHAANRQ